MASTVTITLTDSRTVADLKAQDFPVDSASPHKFLNKLLRYTGSLLAKHKRASLVVQVLNGDGVKASGTVTAASAQAADTVTIGATTLTASSSTTDATHFKVGVSDTADAAALASAIGLNTTLNKYVTASANTGVCTITCAETGVIGNAIKLTSSNNTRLAVVAMASGAQDTAVSTTYHAGL